MSAHYLKISQTCWWISFEVKQLVLKYKQKYCNFQHVTQFWGKVLPVCCCMGWCLAAIAFAVGTRPRSIYNQRAILVTCLVSTKITFSVWYYLEELFLMDYTVVKVTKFVCLSLVTRVLCLENNPGYRQGIVTSVFNFSLQNLLNPFWFMLEKTR